MSEQDELKRAQKKYHDKAYAKQELYPDAGGLGRARSSYESKQRAGHGLHNPRGGLAEVHSQYVEKKLRRDHGTR
jgi:hypothetical protein